MVIRGVHTRQIPRGIAGAMLGYLGWAFHTINEIPGELLLPGDYLPLLGSRVKDEIPGFDVFPGD